jgi:hypothetical protein
MQAHRVDFPAPLAPTIAILESNPTSILTFFKTCFSGMYPNVTSDIWSSGGEIFSVSGNLYTRRSDSEDKLMRSNLPEFLRLFLLRGLQVRQLLIAHQSWSQA